MSRYRNNLPQLQGVVCLTDGGMETDLCFNRGIELPEFASYVLLRTAEGREVLLAYYRQYIAIARRHGLGLVLETPTWRANRDWGERLGDAPAELDRINRAGVELVGRLRAERAPQDPPLVISGCLGPRGDGYRPDRLMDAEQALDYHRAQVASFAATDADMVAVLTLNYIEEAVGVARAAAEYALPLCISFTVETDGTLPDGAPLQRAIEDVDAATGGSPDYYMINCAHPTHFAHLFDQPAPWLRRIRGLRGNASCMSHAELDEADTLDDGNPDAFGRELDALRWRAPWLTVLGGCCGTDHRHIDQVGRRLASAAA